MAGQHIIADQDGNILSEYITIMFDGQTVGELRDNHYFMNESINERDVHNCEPANK